MDRSMVHRRSTSRAAPLLCLCLLVPACGLRGGNGGARSSLYDAGRFLPKSITQNLVWLNYVFGSSGFLWDEIHDGHTVNDGGIWSYSADVESALETFIERRHPAYDSAWDVASNIGYFLKRLASRHPDRQYFGSDISKVMVNSTRSMCAKCVVEVFDINQLQYANALPTGFPDAVDIIIVADVLNYMSWGRLPPIGNWLYPCWLVRHHQIDFLQHLTRRARKEVIFTASQGNSGVSRFFNDMGIQRVGGFGVAKGTALNPSAWAPPVCNSGSSWLWWLAGATICVLMAAGMAVACRSNRSVDSSKGDMFRMPKAVV